MATLRVGDSVNVPGGMYGVVKFIGSVDGKRGTFAGVELASEYAARGKNSGDVDGKYYFNTTTPGGGIFLPVDKAEKRMSGSSTASSTKRTSGRTTSVTGSPTTPAVVRPTPRPSMVKPSFSQSLGPAPSLQQRVASPTALKPPVKRESSARPTSPMRSGRPSSPLRKTQNAPPVQTPAAGRLQTPKTRPSIGLAKSAIGAPATNGKATGLRAPSYANGGPNKFSQSLRQSTSQTPSRLRGAPSMNASTTPLGPDDRFDQDDTILEQNEPETTPTPATRLTERASVGNAEKLSQEAQRLREQLGERDKQLEEQANSIAEMERSLAELSSMMPDAMLHSNQDDTDLPRDVQALRVQLRERNEKIKALSAEFDANRADFRSTIDTLEMASTETERVYEQRVEDLLQQVQQLQERNEDVDSVAQQFKNLEELVQELEEGLEESRRAEAEARSEVEFLRGEVERGKSELRRERERAATHAALEGGGGSGVSNEDYEELQAALSSKEDEIRGLKTIIQNLQGTAIPERSSYGSPATPKANGISRRHSQTKSINTVISPDASASSEALHRQIIDLESLLQQKSSREEELQEQVRELRKSMNLGNVKLLGFGHRKTDSGNEKHNSGGSQRTIVGQSNNAHTRKDSTIPELAEDDGRGSPLKEQYLDAQDSRSPNRKYNSAEEYSTPPPGPSSVSETSTVAQWCEICEEPGHDILNCANMIGSSTHRPPAANVETKTGKDAVREGLRRSNDSDRPAPLRRKSGNHDPVSAPPTAPLPLPPPRQSRLSAANSGGSNGSSATPASSAQANSSANATPTKPMLIEGTGDQAGMLAGKATGTIDPDKWCALCERDGHESVDCPIEDAF